MSGGPNSGQFAKGRSGNPKGRPRKPKPPPASSFDIIIGRTLTIMQGGVPREVTIDEALQHKTYQEAIGGSRSARREVLKMIETRERAIAARAPQPQGVKLLIEHDDTGNAKEALELLGIAGLDQTLAVLDPRRRHLLLEPWAVLAAMQRRRRRALSEREVAEVRRLTRNADAIAALRQPAS